VTARLLDGKAVSAAMLDRVRGEAAEFAATYRRKPALATVLVGDDHTLRGSVRAKADGCATAGVTWRRVHLASPVTTDEVAARVRALSADPEVDGILVQRPLPSGVDERIDERAVFEAIDPAKDVDGVTRTSLARMALGEPGFVAATPGGIMALLAAYDVRLSYRHAVVVGRGAVLGRPTGMLLLAHDATVTYCHSHTIDLPAHVAEADLLVTATGQPGLIRGKWIKQGAVVVDAGHADPGDVEFDIAAERASLITTVPAGVGPMTTATLLAQTVRAARQLATS
jgi:methylenetetrahydrofolate dehydrogenase (NADP+)/methenyltetrahydrofolate cyclohydrolase